MKLKEECNRILEEQEKKTKRAKLISDIVMTIGTIIVGILIFTQF